MAKIRINRKPLRGRALKRYRERMAELEKALAPTVKAIRDSRRITSDDLQKRINV